MGLEIIKYGEEAVVDLSAFTLDTPRLRSVRKAERAVARKGAEFRIVPAAAVPVIMDELARVSDEWVRAKRHEEKGFSLGRFDRDYLRHFDIALVLIDGRIVAFANLWLTADRSEASVDLMRQVDAAPPGTMDFLFVHLLQWAQARGYRRFTLGIAPLSGIEGRRLAPAWAKAAALVFRHGERFYGFRGLRLFPCHLLGGRLVNHRLGRTRLARMHIENFRHRARIVAEIRANILGGRFNVVVNIGLVDFRKRLFPHLWRGCGFDHRFAAGENRFDTLHEIIGVDARTNIVCRIKNDRIGVRRIVNLELSKQFVLEVEFGFAAGCR